MVGEVAFFCAFSYGLDDGMEGSCEQVSEIGRVG